MTIHIPGFPTEISELIELPDIGEILMYPAFQGIDADNFLKHANVFQRYLFNKIPLRNDRKSVIVRSGVWLLEPGTCSHAITVDNWHFDGVSDYCHLRSDERTFIFSSPCSALTEFNVNPLTINSTADETASALSERINRRPEEFSVVGRKIDPCRIYTLENHLHRAVSPERIEFRFFLRVKETDQPAFETEPIKRLWLRRNGVTRLNIEYSPDRLSICFPERLRSIYAAE